jgi:hypothetical protein
MRFRAKHLHGISQLKSLGFRVVEGELTAAETHQGYRSGSPEERADEFMALILNPEVKALISTIGGENSASMIPYLDFEAIRTHPKVICGYSDVTSLHLAILAHSGLSTFYGPAVVPSFGEWPDTRSNKPFQWTSPRPCQFEQRQSPRAAGSPLNARSLDRFFFGRSMKELTWTVESRSVVLVPGGRYEKRSWALQAPALVEAGLGVLAIDLRGRGDSKAGSAGPDSLAYDVLAAVRYLYENGAKHVYVVGASLGGWAAAEASILAPGEIDRLVLLAAPGVERPDQLSSQTLFIVARDDASGSGVPRLVSIREQHARAPEPKEFVVLDGDLHAQAIFSTDQGPVLLGHILRFLKARSPSELPCPSSCIQLECHVRTVLPERPECSSPREPMGARNSRKATRSGSVSSFNVLTASWSASLKRIEATTRLSR